MESGRPKDKEKVLQEVSKIWYTNVNGLMSKRLELEQLLEREKPDMMIISETNWKEEWGIPDISKDKYDFWIRNRKDKGGGGVMILTGKNICVERVETSKNKAEIIKVVIKSSLGIERSYMGVYVPPRTSAWGGIEYQSMLDDTINELERMSGQEKDVLIAGDFNCKDINWEDRTGQGGDDSWSEKLLNWAEENMMIQWIDCDTRYRGGDAPSRLDLVFTTNKEEIEEIKYKCPLGKSDHILIEINKGKDSCLLDQNYKMDRYKYSRANFDGIKQYFENANWENFDNARNTQEKWDEFIKIYDEAVRTYVPKGSGNCRKGKEWYNRRCDKARKRKIRTWNKWRKERIEDHWRDYIEARNECVKVMREEKRDYEKDIMNKCKKEPKLFYRHVNSKMKKQEVITRLKVDGIVYQNEQDMAEVMNKGFQRVFTEEGDFELQDGDLAGNELVEVEVHRERVMELMENLEVNKAPGPDGVSNWILKECRHQLVDRIQELLTSSLEQGRVPKEWKQANIVPIYKGGSRENPMNYTYRRRNQRTVSNPSSEKYC